ncbi:MAG TPA: NAD(P)/FAD-dependent oxidoreductase [Solirubrobacteraceae bacterium]|jgi:phytoene dehydrogenase-like protein|nr:NAD(P)/FAD-dependent oxidoreductase [Solirubrobacteraceae bacterium]
MPDAIVIGAGPNGLVGANILADAGWDVLVLEAQPSPGGAVRSGEITEPGFVSDLFSAFYPLGIASPHLRALDLRSYGLEWLHAPAVVAHPHSDGSCVTLHRDVERTAESVAAFAPEDGDAWRRLSEAWLRVQPAFVASLMNPFPPIRPALRMLRALGGVKEVVDFARLGVMPLRRHAEEEFRGDGAARLLAGNALHADVTPDSAGSALYGWVLVGLGQSLGWPVARGGAQRITDALVARLRRAGGELRCGEEVVEVVVRGDRAAGVRTAGGEEIAASRAVLADTGAPALYERMLPEPHRIRLKRFEYDNSTVKVDWSLDGPIPWRNEDARLAGTVHVTDGLDAMSAHAAELTAGVLPSKPFLLLGQYSHYDPSRAPAGKEAAWAYTHVAQGSWDESRTEEFADLMEEQVEQRAPGFRKLIRRRHVFTPVSLERADQNLVGGSVNGGTAQIHQQLVFRPTPGLGRPETPVPGLYLASASAHPGGGVHGACGANAARAALSAPARALVPRAIRRLG